MGRKAKHFGAFIMILTHRGKYVFYIF